jgi:hypothetical protein
MPVYRERESQARQLEAQEIREMDRTVGAFLTAEACLECPIRSNECAAGIIDEIRDESRKYGDLSDIDKRRIKSDVRLLPLLTLVCYQCVDRVSEYGQPIDVDLDEIEDRYKSTLAS